MSESLTQKWDLESILTVDEFSMIIKRLDESLTELKHDINTLSIPNVLQSLQEAGGLTEEVDMFLYTLGIEESEHPLLQSNLHFVEKFKTDFVSLQVQFDRRLSEMSEDEWFSLLRDPIGEPIAYLLGERRRQVADKLPPDQEHLVHRLSKNGYHAWGTLRNSHVKRMTFVVDDQDLTMGQVLGLLSHSNRRIREQAAASIDEAFGRDAELLAYILNSLSGFRLETYATRGWDSVLHEPLQQNHMSQNTLDTMFHVLEQYIPKIVPFINRKAELMGLKQLSYYDLTVPLTEVNGEVKYSEARELIVENFKRFSVDMADTASQAFQERWIDSESRRGKAHEGTCVPFFLAKQSRISVNYRGRFNDLLVLSHELGHAYHHKTVEDLPYFARQYPMSVAETASALAEHIVINAIIDSATSEEQRLGLITEKLQRTIPFALLGAFGGYLLEKSIYAERKHGFVSHKRLTELSIQAQKRVYLDCMNRYSEYQWAIQPHIYMTEVPFYNFQYTFGYLFSIGIYSKIKEGIMSADAYRELLRNTGRISVEDLAQRFIGEDITKNHFWETALDAITSDVNEFLDLTEQVVIKESGTRTGE